jgi:tRNA(fMet)-specific endonuclease VapC
VKFLLDTNAVIALLKGHSGLQAQVRQHQPSDFGLSAIVAHELFFGAYRGTRSTENLARIDALRFEVVAFDAEDARIAGELRAALAAAGTPVGPYDVLIAGQALARGLTLITRNLREFRRITSIQVEDWEA